MTKTSRLLVMMMVLMVAAGAEAGAQSLTDGANHGFLNINFGAQPARRDIASSETRTVYEETATIASALPIGNGPIFDIVGGVRLRPRFAVAVGYSRFSTSSDAAIVATIPHPLFFGQPKTVTATQAGLAHTENGIHPQVVLFAPVTVKMDVAFSFGPSFIMVSQEVPVVTIPAATQTITVAVASESGTAVALNFGVDGTYLFTKNLGAGLFLRYTGGKVDLPSAPSLSVGGFQIGVGARIRF